MAKLKKLRIVFPIIFALIMAVSMFAFPIPVSADSADLHWYGGSGNWSDTAHWATIYTTGTADFVNGDATVEGAGGCSWTGLTGKIRVATSGTWYTISSITDSDTLEMTGTFAESSTGAVAYVIATTGHAAPTSTNNVYFDTGSGTATYTVTLNADAYCADMIISNPASGIPVITQSSGKQMYVYGSLTNTSGLTTFNNISINFKSTSTGKTITTNGATMVQALFNGVGGGWTLQDTLTVTSTNTGVDINNGNLNTNGKTVNCSGAFYASSGTWGLSLGASTINCSSWKMYNGTATFDAGTSTINVTSIATDYTFDGNAFTYYNVVYNCNHVASNTSIQNANNFTNLTINGGNVVDVVLSLDSNQTVTGTFTTTGNSASRRLLLKSNTLHTARTITAAAVSASNTLFRDITAAGASSWDLSSSTGVGDCCGNTGITFPTGISVYAVDWIGNGNFSDSTKWAALSNGTGGTGRVPLPQDIAVFDDHSMQINGVIITFDTSHISGLNTVYATRNPQFTGTTQYFYNSINLGTCIWDVQTAFYMLGDGAQTLSGDFSYGTDNLYIDTQGGSITQIGNLTVAGTIYMQSGVWDTGEFDITAYAFDSSTTTYTRALWMVNTDFTLTSTGTKWNVASTNLNIDYAGSEIILTNSTSTACTFAGGGMTYNDLTIEGSGNYSTTLTGANVFHALTIDRTQAAKTLAGAVTATIAHFYIPVYGTTVVTITNTDFTKTSGLVASDYLTISGSAAGGGATYLAGSHSTNGGTNSGWSFTDATAPTVSAAAASLTTRTTANLNGSLDNLGSYSSDGVYIYFQYDLTGAFTTPTETTPMLYTTVGTKTVGITGLTFDTTYHFRIVCFYNNSSYLYGDDTTFLTLGAPTVSTQSATGVLDTRATLNGSLLDFGDYASAFGFFQYGTTTAYLLGSTVPETPFTSVTGEGSFSFSMTGLTPGVTYHYRAAVRYNATQYAYGSDVTFSSSTAAPPFTGIPGVRVGTAPAYSLNITGNFIQNPPAPTGSFSTTITPSFPGSDIWTDVAAASSTPIQLPLMIISGFIILAISLLASWIMRRYSGSGSHFVKAALITALMGVCIAVGIYDWWMSVLFIVIALALSWMSQQRGVS